MGLLFRSGTRYFGAGFNLSSDIHRSMAPQSFPAKLSSSSSYQCLGFGSGFIEPKIRIQIPEPKNQTKSSQNNYCVESDNGRLETVTKCSAFDTRGGAESDFPEVL